MMDVERLSAANFHRAVAFVNVDARPLEQALCAWWFGSGDRETVLAALAAFQNDDGGFGHSIEPDFRLQPSSALGTSIGFQVLRRVGAPANHPMVERAVAYLLDTYNPALHRWQPVPAAIRDVPRAPWWDHDAKKAKEPGFCANPCAELVGYLHVYAEQVPPEFLRQVTDLALGHLTTLPDAMEMHDALCYRRLAECLPEALREPVLAKLRGAVALIVPREPSNWVGYGATPLLFAPSPESLLAPCFADSLDANLDWLIHHQDADGSWGPSWQWSAYPEAWERARQEWKGILTVDTLKTLSDYGRVATSPAAAEPGAPVEPA